MYRDDWPSIVSDGLWFLTLICSFLFVASLLAACQTSRNGEPNDGSILPSDIRELISSFSGDIFFAACDLRTGEKLEFRSNELVQTASVIKLPIMVEVFGRVEAGDLDLAQRLPWDEANRVEGAGILQDLDPGLEITLRDAVTLMIVLSDNTATNMVIDIVGIEPVNDRMRSLGLTSTFLNKKVFLPAPSGLSEERAKWGLGGATAAEMLLLLERLYRRELVRPDLCEEMLAILKKQRDRDILPRFLVGPEWESTEVANKTGSLNQVRNDVGLVFTPKGDFALSLFAQNTKDQKWTPDNEATLILASLSKAILEHFSD